MKTNVNRDGAATGLVRSNTSTGVMKESRSGPTKQGMKVEIIGGTDQRREYPLSGSYLLDRTSPLALLTFIPPHRTDSRILPLC